MKKLVFFLQTNNEVKGAQLLLLKLSNFLAGNESYDVFYVNNIFDEDLEQLTNDKLNVVDIQHFNPEEFDDAVFFTPLNYLGNLLSVIHDLSHAKICLFSYSNAAIDWLCYNLGDKNAKSELIDLFESTNACAFLDKNCVLSSDVHNDYSGKVFLPQNVVENECEDEDVNPISPNEIRIGFVGNIDANSISTINNLINNIVSQNIDKDVSIHLIGNAYVAVSNDFKNMTTGHAHIIYTGPLEFEDMKEYLKNNVDIAVASGSCALDASLCGVPTIIPITSKTAFKGNHYVWIFDTNYNILNWDSSLFATLDYDAYTLKKVFQTIYEQNGKLNYAKKCYDFVKTQYGIENVANNFVDLVDNSELTVHDCFNNATIKTRIDEFLMYKEIYNKDYNAFINYKKNKQAGSNVKELSVVPDGSKKFLKIQEAYSNKKAKIIKKYKKQKRISVGFIVVFNSVFPTRPVFELMLNDKVFEPYIVVAPNVSCSKKERLKTYNDAYYSLSKQYPDRVLHGYNSDMESYVEFKDKFDIVFFCNPYHNLVNPYHDIRYFLDKNVLTIYSSYGFAALKFWERVVASDFYNYLWKACVETESNLKHLQQIQTIHGINGVVTGYIKVDKMAEIVPEQRERKRIIICPHHTVWGWKNLNISNFLKYKDFFIELPKLFPDVDFIFRPHPLLFSNLMNHMHWFQSDVDEYLEKLLENPNMTYDTSGEYFDKFVNSDAMIHDCGSFIGEYLYTEKPCCYMMKSEEETMDGLVPLGQQCMNQYYHAFSKEDIINFIKNVVIGGNDPLKKQREEFVQTELKKNYPHAAETVVKMIKDELKIK